MKANVHDLRVSLRQPRLGRSIYSKITLCNAIEYLLYFCGTFFAANSVINGRKIWNICFCSVKKI